MALRHHVDARSEGRRREAAWEENLGKDGEELDSMRCDTEKYGLRNRWGTSFGTRRRWAEERQGMSRQIIGSIFILSDRDEPWVIFLGLCNPLCIVIVRIRT